MAYTHSELHTMARHYVIACLWADCEEGTKPRATTQAHGVAVSRCRKFLDAIGVDVLAELREAHRQGYGSHPDCGTVAPVFAAIGHDFYLTTAGHGVGFWDRAELEPYGLGDRLTEFCKPIGEPNPTFYRGWLYF